VKLLYPDFGATDTAKMLRVRRYIKSNITLLLGDNDIDKITIYDE
jgi:hypothetical protein